MRTLCGWCPKYFNRPPVVLEDGPADGEISHGICDECRAKWKREEPPLDSRALGDLELLEKGKP